MNVSYLCKSTFWKVAIALVVVIILVFFHPDASCLLVSTVLSLLSILTWVTQHVSHICQVADDLSLALLNIHRPKQSAVHPSTICYTQTGYYIQVQDIPVTSRARACRTSYAQEKKKDFTSLGTTGHRDEGKCEDCHLLSTEDSFVLMCWICWINPLLDEVIFYWCPIVFFTLFFFCIFTCPLKLKFVILGWQHWCTTLLLCPRGGKWEFSKKNLLAAGRVSAQCCIMIISLLSDAVTVDLISRGRSVLYNQVTFLLLFRDFTHIVLVHYLEIKVHTIVH